MYLSKIKVENYKSFRDSGEIEFKSGINIIVGQNNSGKTALLEAIELRNHNKPYKGIKPNTKDLSEIEAEIYTELSKINSYKTSRIYIRQAFNKNERNAQSIFNNNTKKDLKLKAKKISNHQIDIKNTLYEESSANPVFMMEKHNDEYKSSSVTNIDKKHLFWNKILNDFTEKIYRFNSERLNLGKSDVGESRELLPNASNLAQVLMNTKANNDPLYERLVKYVSEVIPSVKWVTSVLTDNGARNEIRIWTISKETEREDLVIPLSECGTGVGQILAILYVVVTSKEPRTIIIDEPNSFLHPGAAKKLIQILNKFPQHQYFISTHSPEILSAAKPSTITRLKYVDGETIAESINLEQTKDLRETLDEIGVRFSDIFFSENILWVEGETEEKAFPLILGASDELFDVAFLPLVHTDDLRERKSKGRKHAKLVFEIYNRLSGANALTPPFIAVILDKESSTPQELTDLTKEFGDKLKFIPRIMYENYLIDAEAITNVLNDEIIENANKISLEQIEKWIEEKRENKFLSKNETSEEVLEINDWLENVHAANLLYNLFAELSNKTVEYRKTTHSVKLTQWLLENKPEQLSELKDFLINLITSEKSS